MKKRAAKKTNDTMDLNALETHIKGVKAFMHLFDGRHRDLVVHYHDEPSGVLLAIVIYKYFSGATEKDRRLYIEDEVATSYVDIYTMRNKKKVMVAEGVSSSDHLPSALLKRLTKGVLQHPNVKDFEELHRSITAQGWSIDLEHSYGVHFSSKEQNMSFVVDSGEVFDLEKKLSDEKEKNIMRQKEELEKAGYVVTKKA